MIHMQAPNKFQLGPPVIKQPAPKIDKPKTPFSYDMKNILPLTKSCSNYPPSQNGSIY